MCDGEGWRRHADPFRHVAAGLDRRPRRRHLGGRALGGDVSIGAGASFTFDLTANVSYAGALSGTGDFVKDGLGTVVLTSDNSAFASATSVNGGTLAAGAANTFSSASQFSVAAGATLDLAGTSQAIVGLTNAGTVGIAGSLGSKLTVSGDYVAEGRHCPHLAADPMLTQEISRRRPLKIYHSHE
ncbi:MAG: hypothetical protein EOR93_18860 [Mesorhizobium sp.]|nr:hypothetical protein EJ079_16015 [Mesorhizobium sp. M7A.F.Ce.TU.012.03.2.1]RWO87313.1 MAG: hypothetical protein EOQ96_12870 [Mesorhizobium sp.]RWP07134.1 MAG: hypothetical protein EOQ97_19460 [Mesorhizobium sp.]RWP90083.1 MAG: hypothetical protein EOR11_07870 [Mesorhizobium sp.]RWP90849.1 MAG: hypothetical protein EOR12_10260 [Mesorhizobium sp.]